MADAPPTATGAPHRALLFVLATAFALRVVAQFMLQFVSPSFLPPFDAWRSGTLSYGALLASQIIILALMKVF